MPYSTPLSYEHEDRDSATIKWVVLFVVLSLLAHAILLLAFIFLSKHVPPPKLESTATSPTVSISLIPPPPPVPKQKKIFMPTPAQKNAVHKDAPVESDHDTRVASHSKADRNPNSFMPDVVTKETHPSALDTSPSAPPVKPQNTATTPPAPKPEQAKPTPTPPQPQQPPTPQQAKAAPQKAPPSTAAKPPPTPSKTQPKTPPPPAVNADGLPVLPSINAQTMAPQTSQNAQQQQVAAQTPAMPVIPMNVQGRAGMSGQPSPEAMKTALGAYKARFYQAVGSRWYGKVGQQMQLIGVGSVRVQYTISPQGYITTKVLDGGNGSMQILLTISVSSIRECSPFLPFPPEMLKEYPNGYTDDFSFSVY